jgi:hypothetical protein
MEEFFASCPRGLEHLLAEDLAAAGAGEIDGDRRRRAFQRRVAGLLPRQSRLADCHPHPLAGRAGALWQRRRRLSSGTGDAVATLVPDAADDPGRCHGAEESAEEHRVRHAAHQGRRLRPFPTRVGQSAERRYAPAGRQDSGFPQPQRMHPVCRYLGRAAASARLPAEDRRRAAEGEPCRRHPSSQRLAAGCAAARPDVWQWHLSSRGGTDGARPGAGRAARIRLSAPAAVSAGALAGSSRAGTGRGACGDRDGHLRQRHLAGGGTRNPCQSRSCRSAAGGPSRGRRSARNRGAGRERHHGQQPALRRAGFRRR